MSTPKEAFLGKRPNVSYFKIFGSFFHSHVTKDATKKLDPTSELGIFLGYTDTSHNYWVYLPSHKMTIVRRDVKFYEDKSI